jgi:hypothetical protein
MVPSTTAVKTRQFCSILPSFYLFQFSSSVYKIYLAVKFEKKLSSAFLLPHFPLPLNVHPFQSVAVREVKETHALVSLRLQREERAVLSVATGSSN